MKFSNSIEITVELTERSQSIPSDRQLRQWANCALIDNRPKAAVAIHLIEEDRMAYLNEQYRHKKGATNILSFEFEAPFGVHCNLLGDIVLCPSQIAQEIAIQPPPLSLLERHWAHLVIHGCLHLLGYHHANDQEAQHMETMEKRYLRTLGYSHPNEEEDS